MDKNEIFIYDETANEKITEEFTFSVIGLSHGHIYAMVKGLLSAGNKVKLKYVYDEDLDLVNNFLKEFPSAIYEADLNVIYKDNETNLIASAAIPFERASIAIKAMNEGKDFFVDKAPLTNLNDLNKLKETIINTKRKYFVYYCESIDNDAAIYARDIIKRGVIGDVFHVSGSAPHRLNIETRPEWFFHKNKTGGIIIDLICHQIHQFLSFTNFDSCKVISARSENFAHKDKDMDDFGDVMVTCENGATGYFRVDWFSPKGINTWGDSRMVIEGTKGYIELRKNCNIGFDNMPDHIYVATEDGVFYDNVHGKAKNTYFYDLISDCLSRTDKATDLTRSLNAIEASIIAQNLADAT